MPCKNEIDYCTRQEHILELIDAAMKRNRCNYNYTYSHAKFEAAGKVGLSYRQLDRALKPYVPTEKQTEMFVKPTNQLELFN